jgi:DNA-binding FrmR family transcriptional regulator
MLHEGRPYSEVVHQISAVRASLDGLMILILEDVMSECSANAGSKAVASRLEELERVVLEIRSARL